MRICKSFEPNDVLLVKQLKHSTLNYVVSHVMQINEMKSITKKRTRKPSISILQLHWIGRRTVTRKLKNCENNSGKFCIEIVDRETLRRSNGLHIFKSGSGHIRYKLFTKWYRSDVKYAMYIWWFDIMQPNVTSISIYSGRSIDGTQLSGRVWREPWQCNSSRNGQFTPSGWAWITMLSNWRAKPPSRCTSHINVFHIYGDAV